MKKSKLYLPAADGAIFAENVGSLLFNKEGLGDDGGYGEGRTIFFKIAIFLIIFVFLLRLFYLTIVNGDKNRILAEENRIRLVNIEGPRGQILDRSGKVLAGSSRIFWLQKQDEKTLINEEQKKNLELDGLAFENYEGELGQIIEDIRRHYPLGEATSHILGYTSQVQKDDFLKNSNLEVSDMIGRGGIEQTYDDFLRGDNGKRLIEVDAIGKKVSILDSISPKQGASIQLTIDSELQKIAYEALKRGAAKTGRGALIAQDVQSGEVLALVSLPTYDPSDIGRATGDLQKPLFNRAVLGNYPPGSIFKIVTALAGLEDNKITKDSEVEDVGEFFFGGVKFSNWYFTSYGLKDGFLKVDRALARSNDIFFFRLAQATGLAPIRKMALALGFGQKTGIDLPSEDFGLLPDEVWKKSTLDADWYGGDTLHLAIGQGYMLATPLQINSLINFMAVGRQMKPYLVSQVDGTSISETTPKVSKEDIVTDANFDIVRQGMKQACQTGGTGWPFFKASYTLGCKTGTAERSQGNPHAWFSAFAPYDSPSISVTVLIEDGGEGSTVAGPVAKEVLDWYFGHK